ncbi:MAG TPA: MOSC domain-containing protein [Microbacterium sp.]|uniref:MOSC domain-containing protein n=1 Tax=Microbacterium sp. TaxID=51671 RepID=UPI002B4A9407|nr:MOSC domain-containing protein [Microbacterium sp.]HKT55219.1 MOSC domain-containing protein [Microbacterium sp.]
MSHLLAVCAVRELHPDAGSVGVTAIDKAPVDGPVRVGRYGVYADVQADRKHHGGLDQAVYAYADEDAAFWAAELGRGVPAGWFGENLRVAGVDVSNARIGEIWRIGSSVELQVTLPRTPCQTFARWVGGDDEHGWVKRFSRERRLGAYLRVLRTGRVEAGDEIVVIPADAGAPTILDVFVAPA